MNEVLIFGHRRPDTDAVTSAIALSYLKNEQGIPAKPFILDSPNTETEFVLDYFGIETPKILNDVKLKIEDVEYYKDFYVNQNVSILKAYEKIQNEHVTAIPVVDENKKNLGVITMKTIANDLISERFSDVKTSYNNILDALEGKEVLKYDDEIQGNILIGAYDTDKILNTIKIDPKTILIVGDREKVINYAIDSKTKLIILVGGSVLTKEQIEFAKAKKVNIIYTDFDSFHTAKLIGLCSYVSRLLYDIRNECVNKKDYLEDLKETSSKLGYNNYPVVNDKGECEGLIRITDIRKKNRKKVILVDHNEQEQSVSGLEDAEIIEIVDHHKIGDLTTSSPINFRNMRVGSSNTIVYLMYNEARVEIPKNIAGIMFSGIISDTLNFTSPTTTSIDIEAAERLAEIAELDREEYAKEMFKAGTNLEGKTIDEILTSDLKVFQLEDEKIAVSQMFTLSAEEILANKEEYIKAMDRMKEAKGYSMFVMFITDIIKKGSFIIYCEASKKRLEDALEVDNLEQGAFMEGVLSRKQQIIPKIMRII